VRARRHASPRSSPVGSAAGARDDAQARDSPFRRRWTWRTRAQVAVAGAALGVLMRLLYATLRVRTSDAGDTLARHAAGERFVFGAWHDTLLLLPLVQVRLPGRFRPRVMLSWHRDAEIGAQAARRFGVQAIRGSSTRGRVGAIRGLLEAHRAGEDLLIIPDGPRGPRHVAKDGIVQLARATGARIVPVAFAAAPARRLGSWDRMQVPVPFARVAIHFGAPLAVSDDAAAARVTAALDEAARAAARAVGGAGSG
jgi:lysophospholipid acyltransferase (LPLAT)-like uncharacterized protein